MAEGLERDEWTRVVHLDGTTTTRLADDLIELVVGDVARDVNVRKAGRLPPHVVLEHARAGDHDRMAGEQLGHLDDVVDTLLRPEPSPEDDAVAIVELEPTVPVADGHEVR